MGSNIENTTTGIGWLERVLETVQKYHIWDFCKAFIVILFTALIVGFISNPTYIFEQYKLWEEEKHQEEMVSRLQNTNKIQSSIEKLLYRTEAARVILLELHNGQRNMSGIPFPKTTATFEALNDNIFPISDQYKDVNLSLIPFADYLFKNGYYCGNTEDMKNIDKSLCYRMLSNETQHFAACVIEGVDGEIGFLFVSFDTLPSDHDCERIKKEVLHTAVECGVYLELKKSI